MAFSSSGWYVLNIIDVFDATQLALDFSLTTHKWALYTNSLTPDFSANSAYSSTNEVANGNGYTTGGKDLTGLSPTVTESPSSVMKYDMNDIAWTSASFTARGAILYADALAGDNLIVGMAFGADYTATNGTFTIQFASGGVATIDLY